MSQIFVSPDGHFSVSSPAATSPEHSNNPATRPALTAQLLAGLEDLKSELQAYRANEDRQ
jgi:hypothetical protein